LRQHFRCVAGYRNLLVKMYSTLLSTNVYKLYL
jgi:uncharacterized protein YutE (UPF0331/DUF86 family)